MNVSDAIFSRSSVRAFTKKPVDNLLIKSLLEKSSRSPSGGNLQPWKIYVLNNQSMIDFLAYQDNWDKPETWVQDSDNFSGDPIKDGFLGWAEQQVAYDFFSLKK